MRFNEGTNGVVEQLVDAVDRRDALAATCQQIHALDIGAVAQELLQNDLKISAF